MLKKIGLSTALLLLILTDLCAATRIMVVGLFKDKAVIVINGQRHLLSLDSSPVTGVRLIASNSERAILQVDGKQQVYKAEGAVGSIDADQNSSRVQIWPDQRGMYVTDGIINNYPVKFLVDTGATLIAMNSNHAQALGILYRLNGTEAMATTASGNVKMYVVTLPLVKVGSITVRNVSAAVIRGSHPQQILLGMSFLSQIKLVNEGKAMTLVQD